jgi:DNA-binding beta-propeller fold protein YncE
MFRHAVFAPLTLAALTFVAIPLVAPLPSIAANLPTEIQALINEAGNTADDTVRLAKLRELARHPSAGETLRHDAAGVSDIAEAWNKSAGGEAFRLTRRAENEKQTAEFEFQTADDSPLRPIAELYRGRMLAWSLIQNSNIRTNPAWRKLYKDQADRSFAAAAKAFPENPIPAMYLGKAVPWPREYADAAGAPRWAVLQREHLDRTREIIRWWIANRQRADGSFGGGWGDDCEMWRWWSPVLLGFDDSDIVAAQKKFSRAALARPHLKQYGFLETLTDVEHAAEDTTDNLVPLVMLEPKEKKWPAWSSRIIDRMEQVWTGKNERGGRQFKAFYFSATEVTPKPERQLDVIANVAAVNPALLTWLRTRNPALGKPITEWLDTWVDATAREENGKPAGVLPASISWPDGGVGLRRDDAQKHSAVVGAAKNWWEPVAPGGSMYGYYRWPSVITEMTDALLVAHLATGEEKYLAPIRSMAALRLKYLKAPQGGEHAPGSEMWCGAELGPRENANSNTGALVKTLAKCKALTGTTEFDELLALEGAEFVLSGDARALAAVETALEQSLATLRQNFAGFTSEVHGTDRVMRFVQYLAKDYDFDGYRGVTLPKNELVYRMVSGDANAPRFPMPAVRWRTPSVDIAALVTVGNLEAFEAKLFHFGTEPRKMTADFKLLKPGSYALFLYADEISNGPITGGPILDRQGFEVGPAGGSATFTLPSRRAATLTVIRVDEKHKADDETANAETRKINRPAGTAASGKNAATESEGSHASVETVVVAHKWDDSVGFYNAATGKLEKVVPVGRRPHELARSRDGRYAYATLYGLDLYTETVEGGRKVAIVDLEKREKAGDIDLEKFRRPHGIEVGPQSGLLYVTCDHPAALVVLDPQAKKIVRAIELADKGALPHMTAVAHDESIAYTANCGNASVTMIDLKSGKELKQIPIGGVPMGMAITPDGRTLYAVNRTAEGIAVIDAKTGELERILAVPGQPVRVSVTPDGTRLLATCIVSGDCAIIDTASHEIVGRVPIGNRVEGLAVDATGRIGFASAQADDKVIRFTIADARVRRTIPAKPRPDPLLLLSK